jgi:hypothetical protein
MARSPEETIRFDDPVLRPEDNAMDPTQTFNDLLFSVN